MKGKIALIALVILSLAAYAPATCFIDFITESVPIQHVGVATNFQFQVCCGTPPYTFTIASGSLPPGLSLSSTGKITGTPTTAGYYTVCILLTDSVGCHLTQCFEVNVE
ncbi:MAG: autotransporter protein [Acidobacteria bacterium]|nr:autotransporter protein [Acidobacteriota bacterium]